MNSKDIENEVIYQLMQYNKQEKKLLVEIAETAHQCKQYKEDYKQFLIFVNKVQEFNNIFEKCLSTGSQRKSLIILIVATNTTDQIGLCNVTKSHKINLLHFTEVDKTLLSLFMVKTKYKEYAECNTTIHDCEINARPNLRLLDNNVSSLKICLRIVPPFVYQMSPEIIRNFKLENLYYGNEVFILKELIHFFKEKVQFTGYDFVTKHYDEKTQISSKLVKKLVEGEFDLIFGAMDIRNYSQFIQPACISSIGHGIAIVKTRKDNELMKIFTALSWKIWLFTSLIFIILICFSHIIWRILKITNLTDSISFKLFTIMLGQDINLNSIRFLELLFLSWTWFTYLLRLCFEANITSLFIDKDSSTQIDNINEICEKNYTIFIEYNFAIHDSYLQFPKCNFSINRFVYEEVKVKEKKK